MRVVYRYEVKNRELRSFNQTGKEKNPNRFNFYAKTLEYAEKYNSEYYECTLVSYEIDDSNIFDMTNDFKNLITYRKYIDSKISTQMNDYTRFMNEAKKVKERKMWQKQIDYLQNRENELIDILINNEFQMLSDFDLQNDLLKELTELGFKGYKTKNELVIF